MSRAIILPTVGDPFLLSAWLRLYNKYFKNEVDNTYVLVASDMDDEVLNYSYDLFSKMGCKVFKENHCIMHGDAIRYLLERCSEDYVCLLEEDLFVLQPNVLSQQFERVERGECDIVGSTRGCTSIKLINKIANQFNLAGSFSPEHPVSQCPNLWPCLLFTKKEYLLNTDRDFNNKVWVPGDHISPLDFTIDEVTAGDTFVWASIQLRAAGLKIDYCHQGHASNLDLVHCDNGMGLFIPGNPWVHFGSLSSGFSGSNLLLCEHDGIKTSASRLKANRPTEYAQIDQITANVEIARRTAIFSLLSKHHLIKDLSLNIYNERYIQSINNAVLQYNIETPSANFERVYNKLLQPMWSTQ